MTYRHLGWEVREEGAEEACLRWARVRGATARCVWTGQDKCGDHAWRLKTGVAACSGESLLWDGGRGGDREGATCNPDSFSPKITWVVAPWEAE